MRRIRTALLFAAVWSVVLSISFEADATEPRGVRTAFFYGTPLPQALVDHYDRVIVDPDHFPTPRASAGGHAQLLAYVSLGEVGPSRSWGAQVPRSWCLGDNQAFHSRVIDVRRPEWNAFVLQRVIGPLWQKGYRGFFLDTLDSYQLYLKTPAEKRAAVRGLARLIRNIKHRYPGAILVANRGFELLPSTAPMLDGIVAESLFRGYDAKRQQFVAVPEKDRVWLERRLTEARTTYSLPVVVIDYLPRSAAQERRSTAAAIAKLGFMPWVATPSLDDFGVGAVEVIPRRVLLVHDEVPQGAGVSRARRLIAPPLEALGYTVEERHLAAPLPSDAVLRTVAGVVVWVRSVPSKQRPEWRRWLLHQRSAGVRLAFLESFGFVADASFLRSLGLASIDTPVSPHRIASKAPWIGFESRPPLRHRDRLHYRVDGVATRSMLRIDDGAGRWADAVVLGVWGGAAFTPYVLADGPEYTQRWILDPVEFLRAALALPQIPAPDVTTECGRRVVTTVVAGGGFTMPSDLRGNPTGGRVIYDSILTRENLPTTVLIDASSEEGKEAKELIRRISALPNVEVATTLSGPDGAPLLDRPLPAPRFPENDSMTLLQPLGLPTLGRFAVLVPGADDIQYNAGFVAPFDRYRRAIQTFEVDDGPKRLRPIGIRYSFLSGTKAASLRALRDVYGAVRRQSVFPLWLSEYASRVKGFEEATIARRLDGAWEVAGLGELRTLRVPATEGWPDLDASQSVLGVHSIPQGRFIHLTDSRARLVLKGTPPGRVYLAHANARVLVWAWNGEETRISLAGHLPVELVVGSAGAEACTLAARGRVFHGKKDSSGVHFSLPWSEIRDAALTCSP